MTVPHNTLGVDNGGQDALATSFHAVFRFLRTVRLRSGILLMSVVVAGIAGTFYYVTAPRIYQSTASLYISRVGASVTDDGGQGGNNPSRDMPTFAKLMSEEEVIKRALEQLPKQFRTDLEGVPEDHWVATIREQLSVSSAFNTNVLDLRYRSQDPRSAAAVLNALLSAYESFMNRTHQGSSETNLQTLETRIGELKQELARQLQQRNQLKASAPDLVDISNGPDPLNVVVEAIRHLTVELSKAREETTNAQSMVSSIQQAINGGENILQYALNSVDGIGRQLIEQSLGLGGADSIQLERLNQEVLNLTAELRDAESKYLPNHPMLKKLKEEIQIKENYILHLPEIRRQKLEQLSATRLAPQLLQMAQQRLRVAQQKEQAILQRLTQEQNRSQQLATILTSIHDLDREVERNYTQLDYLIESHNSIKLNKNSNMSTEVTTRPHVAQKPVSPRLAVTGFISLFLGSVVGVAIIWVLDINDDRFRTPEELKLQLDTQLLTMVPEMQPLPGSGFASVITNASPNSTEAESFRALRTSVEFSPKESSRIVCTSTEPGDGKTTISSNMAVAFAQSGRKTLLIDADMRRPGLSTLLEMRESAGLSQILRSNQDIDESVKQNLRTTVVDGLDVIPCGLRPMNPAELLASERFANLLAWAETRYEQIIVDAPPVLAVSDPAIIGRFVDAVILVVRPDKDRRRLVIRAAESLRTLGCDLLGVVVNHLSPNDAEGYGYGYGYGYKYSENSNDDAAKGLSEIAGGGLLGEERRAA
jgi:capsular exopolysaccharide synthesis family protein